jgi:hypothetical protein
MSVNRRRADLVLEPADQQVTALVMQRAAAHVDRLDARRRRRPDGFVIVIADDEVVLHRAPQRRQGQHERGQRLAGLAAHLEPQTILRYGKAQCVWTVVVAFQHELVGIDDVVDRHLALVLDIGIGSCDGLLIELDRHQA